MTLPDDRRRFIDQHLADDPAVFDIGDRTIFLSDIPIPQLNISAAAFIRELLGEIDRLNHDRSTLIQAIHEAGPWPHIYDNRFCCDCSTDLPAHQSYCPGAAMAELLARDRAAVGDEELTS